MIIGNIPNEDKTSFQQHSVVKLPRGIKNHENFKNEFKIKKPNEISFSMMIVNENSLIVMN